MKHEVIVTSSPVTFIGISKQIMCNEGYLQCPKFWDEYWELYGKAIGSGAPLSDSQKVAAANHIGQYALCYCAPQCASSKSVGTEQDTFTYAICGRYQGGTIPAEMQCFTVKPGKWLKVYFQGDVALFQEHHRYFYETWLPEHPEIQLDTAAVSLEWYGEGSMHEPHYEYGLILPLLGE